MIYLQKSDLNAVTLRHRLRNVTGLPPSVSLDLPGDVLWFLHFPPLHYALGKTWQANPTVFPTSVWTSTFCDLRVVSLKSM